MAGRFNILVISWIISVYGVILGMYYTIVFIAPLTE